MRGSEEGINKGKKEERRENSGLWGKVKGFWKVLWEGEDEGLD